MNEETQQHRNVWGFLQNVIYIFIFAEIYVQTLAYKYDANTYVHTFNQILIELKIFSHPIDAHVISFCMIVFMGGLTQARKDIHFNIYRHFVYPFFIGLCLFVGSIFTFRFFTGTTLTVIYACTYLLGAIMLFISIGNVSKRIHSGLKKDVWNVEEESFAQNTKLMESPLSFNLPMSFYHKKRFHNGWINVNPFRGTLVVGVPGSGKSESVIVPFIKQMLGKGFSMLIYDFKYPDLGEIAYYHYLKNRAAGGNLKDYGFHVVNLNDVERSRRINPLSPQFIQSLSDATETADAIISGLKKTSKNEGAQQFFTQSAINFLAAVIYYLATYEEGKYSTLPHVLAFLGLPYDDIFNSLFSHPELHSLLAPFQSAYKNQAFDQLEGQIGTVRINLSRIATKEAFWVFSGNDFDLKISNPPSILILANSASTQNMNSAFYSAVLMRVIQLINSKGNNPSAIVVDEAPTIFLHKIENLVATARSNKVAVMLGLQELPQLYAQYGKETGSTITSIMGSVFAGAVRSKETLDWLEKLFGRAKQTSNGVSIDRHRTNISINERMENMIPASKIANLNTGEMVAMVAREATSKHEHFSPNMFNCKINVNMKEVQGEQKHYVKLPKYYTFGNNKNQILLDNMNSIREEVARIASESEVA